MNPLLFATLAVLAPSGITPITSGTVSLAYNECRITTTPAADNDFVWPTQPCTDPANAGKTATIVAAFKNANAIPNFFYTATFLSIQAGDSLSGRTPDFWSLGAGGCHENGLSSAASIGFPGGVPVPANCGNPYGDPAGQTNVFGSTDYGYGDINFVSYHFRESPLPTLDPPTSPGGYISSLVSLTWDDAAHDGGTCAGCDVPACIMLRSVRLYDSGGSLVADLSVPETGIRFWVDFYGGLSYCPGAVPTRNATWGQVKALYR